MAHDIITDSNGRWLFSATGGLVIKDDAERVAQQVSRRLGMIKGRYAFDITMGLPLLAEDGQGVPQKVFLSDKSVRDSTRRSIIVATAMQVSGVKSVDSISIDIDASTRKMTVHIAMTTDKGLVSTTAGM